MRRLLEKIAAPPQIGDNVKKQINRAASAVAAQVSPSKVKKLWYDEACSVDAIEADHIRMVAAERDGKQRLADAHFAKVTRILRRPARTRDAQELPIFSIIRGAEPRSTDVPAGPSGLFTSGRSSP